jgi:hypothetical protein
MGTWTLKFEHAGPLDFLRWRRPAAGSAAQVARTSATPERGLGHRRAEAMRAFFPKLSAWFAKRSYLAEMREVERYLSQATDMFDLERRIRNLERQGSAARWS